MESIDRKHAFGAPAAVFAHPFQVIQTNDLSHDEKLVVLRNWKRTLEQVRQRCERTRAGADERLEVETRLAAVTDALNSMHTTH
jgi:hypothetical protein